MRLLGSRLPCTQRCGRAFWACFCFIGLLRDRHMTAHSLLCLSCRTQLLAVRACTHVCQRAVLAASLSCVSGVYCASATTRASQPPCPSQLIGRRRLCDARQRRRRRGPCRSRNHCAGSQQRSLTQSSTGAASHALAPHHITHTGRGNRQQQTAIHLPGPPAQPRCLMVSAC